ncbi:hypothetical protein MPER_06039, partial [Moniliophthora perniciosa FA553]
MEHAKLKALSEAATEALKVARKDEVESSQAKEADPANVVIVQAYEKATRVSIALQKDAHKAKCQVSKVGSALRTMKLNLATLKNKLKRCRLGSSQKTPTTAKANDAVALRETLVGKGWNNPKDGATKEPEPDVASQLSSDLTDLDDDLSQAAEKPVETTAPSSRKTPELQLHNDDMVPFDTYRDSIGLSNGAGEVTNKLAETTASRGPRAPNAGDPQVSPSVDMDVDNPETNLLEQLQQQTQVVTFSNLASSAVGDPQEVLSVNEMDADRTHRLLPPPTKQATSPVIEPIAAGSDVLMN